MNGVCNLVVGTSGHSVRRASQFVAQQSKCRDDSGFGGVRLEFEGRTTIRGSYHVVEKNKGKVGGGEVKAVIKDEFVINK